MDDGGVRTYRRSVVQSDRAYDDRTCPDTDPITEGGPPPRAVPHRHLLVDPAMMPDRFCGHDRGDAVLNEEPGSDSIDIEDEGRCRAVQQAKQETQCGRSACEPVVDQSAELR